MDQKQIVIIGGGFGGLTAAQSPVGPTSWPSTARIITCSNRCSIR